MRVPVRWRGLIGGVAVVAVGPLALLGGSHQLPSAARPAPSRGITALTVAYAPQPMAVHLVPPRDPMARDPEPAPTPAPPPPTPAPSPEPTATPTPPPVTRASAATAAPAPAASNAPGTIESIIVAAADRHGVSSSWMLKIARCESGLNPRAYNPAGPYIGLFQFLPSTFRAHGGTDIYDPTQQAEITATMLANGGAGAWGCA